MEGRPDRAAEHLVEVDGGVFGAFIATVDRAADSFAATQQIDFAAIYEMVVWI